MIPNRRLPAVLLLGAVVVGLGASACHYASTAPGTTPVVTSVVILHIDTIQQVPPTPSPRPARTTVRGAAAAALYRDLLQIPHAASGDQAIACPADFGVVYRLTFLAGSKVIARAIAQGAGCRTVTVLPGTTLDGTSSRAAAFWSDLGRLQGVRPDQLGVPPTP
jgi:hypothetical protein